MNRDVCVLSQSVVSDSLRPCGCAVAHQASLSMGVFRQEYWNGVPFPPLGNLPDPEAEPTSPALQTDSLSPESLKKPGDETEVAAEGRS